MKLSNETRQILKEKGYNSLDEYLGELSEDTGVDIEAVYMAADLLGETELFDGLVSMIGDIAY